MTEKQIELIKHDETDELVTIDNIQAKHTDGRIVKLPGLALYLKK